MRFTSKEYTTNWNRLEVGIAMRYSLSPILFVLPKQLLLKATVNNADIQMMLDDPKDKMIKSLNPILKTRNK